MREELAEVAERTRAARAACPSQAMSNAGAQILAADPMLNDVARKDHAHSGLRGELAHYEIFGEIVSELSESTDCRERLLAGRYGRADGELHAFDHARDQKSGQEIRVHAFGFELRPVAFSGDRAIGACGHGNARIAEFGCDGAEEAELDADVAIAHYQYFVLRFGDHAIEAVDFRVRVRRVAGYDQTCLATGKFLDQSTNNHGGGIGGFADGEE